MLCNTEPGEATDAEWEEMAGTIARRDGESTHMPMGTLDHLTFLSLLTRLFFFFLIIFLQILTLGDGSTLKLDESCKTGQ